MPFYGKKIPDPQEGAGLELVVLDEAQSWGLGWDLLGGGCDLVGFPGLGGPLSCEERAEVATLEPQCRDGRAPEKHQVHPISLFYRRRN